MRSPSALLLLAPGAGAPSSSAWMRAWAERLSALGDVVAFDYPYQREGRRRPDRLPALIASHRTALAGAHADRAGPVVLIGKSMGSRIGCHVSLEEKIDALVCLGYPLVGATRGELRDQVLLELETPVLFVQGTRDPLCPLDRLESVRARMKAPNTLHVVEGGDHSLELSRSKSAAAARRQEDSDAHVLAALGAFLEQHLSR